jgi:hypothetical protein
MKYNHHYGGYTNVANNFKNTSQMLYDGLDYDKTVETKRLVFKGQLSQKIHSYIILLLIIAFGLIMCYKIFDSLISGNPFHFDYLFILILLVIVFSIAFVRLLNRDKLKEIEINLNSDNAKVKILKAAKNLNWKPDISTKYYIVFKTKYEFFKDSQSVTLIFFPDNRIYFNSLHYPNDYWYPARFIENYQALMDEYLKIEKE